MQKQLEAAREVIAELRQELIDERCRYRWAHFADGAGVSAIAFTLWITFVAWWFRG